MEGLHEEPGLGERIARHQGGQPVGQRSTNRSTNGNGVHPGSETGVQVNCKLVIIRNKDLNSDRVLEQTDWLVDQ